MSVDGIDLGLLTSVLGRLDPERIRHRRILFNWLYYRVQSLLGRGGAISFGDMLMLVAQHTSAAVRAKDTLRFVVGMSPLERVA